MTDRPPPAPGLAYAAIIPLAIATAVLLKRRGDRALPLSPMQRWGISLGAFCGAMIGAKLPYVLLDREGLVSVRAWFDNGKSPPIPGPRRWAMPTRPWPFPIGHSSPEGQTHHPHPNIVRASPGHIRHRRAD
jgi:hypothetical protein